MFLGCRLTKLNSALEYVKSKYKAISCHQRENPAFTGNSRLMVYDYVISVPSLGLKLMEGYDETLFEEENSLTRYVSDLLIVEHGDVSEEILCDDAEKYLLRYIRENGIETDISDIKVCIDATQVHDTTENM